MVANNTFVYMLLCLYMYSCVINSIVIIGLSYVVYIKQFIKVLILNMNLSFLRFFPTVVEQCQFYTMCTVEGKSV